MSDGLRVEPISMTVEVKSETGNYLGRFVYYYRSKSLKQKGDYDFGAAFNKKLREVIQKREGRARG